MVRVVKVSDFGQQAPYFAPADGIPYSSDDPERIAYEAERLLQEVTGTVPRLEEIPIPPEDLPEINEEELGEDPTETGEFVW